MGIILPCKKYVSQNGGKRSEGMLKLILGSVIFSKHGNYFLQFSNGFFHAFMYFDILKTVANWTLKSNVVLFENTPGTAGGRNRTQFRCKSYIPP